MKRSWTKRLPRSASRRKSPVLMFPGLPRGFSLPGRCEAPALARNRRCLTRWLSRGSNPRELPADAVTGPGMLPQGLAKDGSLRPLREDGRGGPERTASLRHMRAHEARAHGCVSKAGLAAPPGAGDAWRRLRINVACGPRTHMTQEKCEWLQSKPVNTKAGGIHE